MKKNILLTLALLCLLSNVNIAHSDSVQLTDAINLYKAGNYSECYMVLDDIIKNDPSNPIAYYYKAMSSTQLGKREEALSNYEKAIILSPDNNNLSRYAKKGKRCIETPDKCETSLYETIEEEFIKNKRGPKSSEKVRSDYERLKIENIMRQINRQDDIDPKSFKEYHDFSSMEVPSNDEIVAALRVLQNAGLNNVVNTDFRNISAFTGDTNNNSLLDIMGSSSMNPQLIQALLTNNMSQGF